MEKGVGEVIYVHEHFLVPVEIFSPVSTFPARRGRRGAGGT